MNTKLLSAAAMAVLAGAPAANAQTVVDLWHVFNLETDMMQIGVAAFNESRQDVQIEQRVVPFAQLREELIRAVAVGDVPDLVVIDNPVLASFAAQGALAPIGDMVAASEVIDPDVYFAGPWSTVVFDGEVYGVPRASNTLALYFNADMFREAGLDPKNPPQTWSELMAAAEALTDADASVFGIAFSAIQSEESTFQWLPFLYQAGGSLEDLRSPEAAAALQLWVDMVDNGYASRDVITMRQYEGTNTLIAGNAAMAISGPWELPRISAEAAFDWEVALLPVRDEVGIRASALGGFNWAIPAGAEDAEAAFEVIEYMSMQDTLQYAWGTGRIPSRRDVSIPQPDLPLAYLVFAEQMESATARGPHPEWPAISRAIQTAIQQALTGTASVEDALAQAADAIEPILAEQPL